MPGTRARRLCPQAVVVSPDYDDFTTVSRAVMETFRRVTPLVEAVSLDEAFLDVRGSAKRLGSPLEIKTCCNAGNKAMAAKTTP